MSIVKSQLQDFMSSAPSSAGGEISATQIPATELAIATSAGATSITRPRCRWFCDRQRDSY